MSGPGYKTLYTEEDADEAILQGVMKRVSLVSAHSNTSTPV